MTTISVIIPVFNGDGFIREALESVLRQTRLPQEVLVVDDASTDGTADMMAGYGEKVRLVRNSRNQGPGTSREIGFRRSRSDYVAFLDADDKWAPAHLETLAGLLDRWPEAGVAFSRLQDFGEKNTLFPEAEDCPETPEWVFVRMIRNIISVPSGMMVRRAVYENAGPFQELHEYCGGRRIQGEDFDFAARLALAAPFVASRTPTAYHRWHGGQSSVFVAPQRVANFKYRLRIIEDMKEGRLPAKWLPEAEEKTRICWEQWIEWHWARRDMAGVRAMVRFGLRQSLLREAAKPYAIKSCIPAWVLRLRDRLGNHPP